MSPDDALRQAEDLFRRHTNASTEQWQERLGVAPGGTTQDGTFTLEDAECLALCGNAPCLTANWRFFGDVDTVRHKLEVLDRHCEALGRDPATITKTRLGTLIIHERPDEAARMVEAERARRGVPAEMMAAMVVAGDPDAVAHQEPRMGRAEVLGVVLRAEQVRHRADQPVGARAPGQGPDTGAGRR